MDQKKEQQYIPSCLDFTEFEDFLHSSRKLNDNAIYTLNKTDGSLEQCSNSWKAFQSTFQLRDSLIRKCITELEENTKIQSETNKKFLSIRRQVSWLKSELDVEKILQANSSSLFKAKCPGFKPQVEDLPKKSL